MDTEPVRSISLTSRELYRLIQTFDRKAEETADGERDPEDAKLLTKLLHASNDMPQAEPSFAA